MKGISKKARFVAYAGIIGALYAVITLMCAPIAYGEINIRLSEALCVLPFFTPAAVPGLFVGCLVVLVGSLATLCGALGAYLLGRLPIRHAMWLVPLPEVVFNAIAVPFVIKYGYGSDYGLPILALSVLIGQIISCYFIGMPLMFALKKLKKKVFSVSFIANARSALDLESTERVKK